MKDTVMKSKLYLVIVCIFVVDINLVQVPIRRVCPVTRRINEMPLTLTALQLHSPDEATR